MGGFFLARRRSQDEDLTPRLASARAIFARMGLGPAETLSLPACEIALFRKIHAPTDMCVHGDNGDFCAITGTVIYRRQTGSGAAQAFLADARDKSVRWDEIYGNYCIIMGIGGEITLQTDRIGTYHVWHDEDRRFYSSSFLAAAAARGRASIDPQAVYEYVFQGATYGGASVLREISLHDCGTAARLDSNAPPAQLPRGMVRPPAGESIGAHLERNLDNLRRYYQAIAACFPAGADTALSGGYDSRLTLALLRAQNIPHKIHVYGTAEDSDVTRARAIAEGEGLDLKHVDKSRFPRVTPDEFPDTVERSYWTFDGFPADGIFDNGADIATRSARAADGTLMLNGGGGEVFRNFFYLPNRRYLVRHLLWSFYTQLDPAAAAPGFSLARYHDALAAKIKAALGRGPGASDRLSRQDVEFLYPNFRCRFWMGKNNSNNNRLGHTLTPFIDANIVPDALNLPLKFKNHGRMEARMIQEVDPVLASYGSAYGHSFDVAPPLKRRLKDWATLARPVSLRRFTFRLRHRANAPRPYVLSDAYLQTVIDPGFPYMSRYFVPARLHDAAQFNRLCTLEYLFQRLQPDFAESVHGTASAE